MISPLHATLLGILEGLTEFLPISSTGHLILASSWLGVHGEAVKTLEIAIQAGALVAVLGLYRDRVAAMWRGCRGADPVGQALCINLLVSFAPAAAAGLFLHRVITNRLFTVWAVAAALAVGGVLMILVDHRTRGQSAPVRLLETITVHKALLIGCAQCLALWPGTSRAMVTIVAGLLLGLPSTVAAEYSFLLALPTLGAVTVLALASGGRTLVQDAGWGSLVCGFLAAAVVAALAIRGFLRYLTRWGLAPFGWYRLALAAVVWAAAPQTWPHGH